MAIILNWSNPNSISIIEDEIRLYRATSAFDENNLPAVLAVLPAGATRYVDQSAIDGQLYFYRVALVKSGSLILSDFHQVRAPSDGKAVSGTPFEFADCPKYFIQDFSKTPLFDSGHADSIRGNNHSTRKLLAAMVVIDEKLDVLDTEYITITSEDISSTGGEWLSGMLAGDQVTWAGLLELLLVPSKSDIAATCNRVMGEHLRDKYKIGVNNDQTFGYFMTQAALRSGCVDVLAFSNDATFAASNHTFNSAGSKTLFTARSMATVIGYVYERYPKLVEILKLTSTSVDVKRAADVINLKFPTMTINQHGGGGYEIGKTGDDVITGHEMFVFTTPSNDRLCGVTLDNPSRDSRWVNTSSFILSLPNLRPEYRADEIANDPSAASLAFRIQGDSFTDLSANNRVVTPIGNAAINNSLFFKDKAIHLPVASGFKISGSVDIGLSDFTLECYFRKTDGASTNNPKTELIGQWQVADKGRSWALQIENGNKINFWYSVDGSDIYSIDALMPSAMLAKNMPIHIAVQRKSGVLGLFLNGVLMQSANADTAFYSTLSNILVGCRVPTEGVGYENHLSGAEIHEVSMKIGVAEYAMSGFTPTYRWRRWD